MSKLKRSDEQYLEIEGFEDYELTQCMTYELAIRNPLNIKKINQTIKFYNDNKNYIEDYIGRKYGIYNKITEEYDFDSKLYHECSSAFYQLDKMIGDIEIFYTNNITDSEFENIQKKTYYKDKVFFGEEIYDLREKVFEFKYGSYAGDKQGADITFEHNEVWYPYSEDEEGKLVDNIKEFKALGNENFSADYVGISIEENFKRPKIYCDPLTSKDIILKVSLNSPLNEIINYIKLIKMDIDKNDIIL